MKTKKFQLIKEYPGSPKLGTVVKSRNTSKSIPFYKELYFDDENVMHYSPELIENYPEFWEEIQFNKRYPMCKDQNAQIDCRVSDCIYHDHGQCNNISPAITLNPNKIYVCWSCQKDYN